MQRFAETLAGAGLETLIVHARKAWLHGLSPKENREIPPLNYERVYRLKQEFPRLAIIINGGIVDANAAQAHCATVDGVMLGRAAYHDPFVLARCEQTLFGTPLPDRDEILQRLQPYIEAHLACGGALNHIARHILGLYLGLPGARAFRRILSERMHRSGADFRLIEEALAGMGGHARAA